MSNKRFEITIKETCVETKICGNEWKKKNDIPECDYAYTPEIEKQVEVTRTIYTQNTDSLDLESVILAVNGINQ